MSPSRDYKLAYAQVRVLNDRYEMLQEVKAVAGIIISKVCRVKDLFSPDC